MAETRFFLHIDGSQIKKSAIPKQGVNIKVVDNHLITIEKLKNFSSSVSIEKL